LRKFILKRIRRLIRLFRPVPRCCICGGTKFRPGPKDRLSATGRNPLCKSCRSLERHRIFNKIVRRLGTEHFKSWRCLQFSKDPTVRREWFASFEASIYGQQNSLDLQAIARPDASYDVVICNHVLEHVADYRAALRELRRILNPRGFLLLSFPDPYNLERTEDWGFANQDEHGHFRIFGRDVEPIVAAAMTGCAMVKVTERDEVTDTVDVAYIITANPVLEKRARGLKPDGRTLPGGNAFLRKR
jgi:SAM-dependent methyltransferase